MEWVKFLGFYYEHLNRNVAVTTVKASSLRTPWWSGQFSWLAEAICELLIIKVVWKWNPLMGVNVPACRWTRAVGMFGSRHKGQLLIHDCRKLDSHGNEISPCLIALALTHLYTVVNLLSPPLLSTQTRCSCPQHEPSLSLTFAPCLDTIKP